MFKIRNLYFLIFLCFGFKSYSFVLSPKPTCVRVQTNGDVTLNWELPLDPLLEFTNYKIYTANAFNGPYGLLTTINTYNQLTYTHVGANANAASKFYYIECTSTGSIVAAAADTVQSMMLLVNNPSNGTAVLNYSAISNPLPASASGIFNIYKEYPTGTWTLVGSTTSFTFIDTLTNCQHIQINYRVEMADFSGCSSVSPVKGAILWDEIGPKVPILDSVSVDNNGNAVLGLNPSSSSDAVCYLVLKKIGVGFVTIDTVCGMVPQIYTYANSLADAVFEDYEISAIDSCDKVGLLTTNQRTIFLTNTYTICDREINLTWTPYINMKNGLKEYQIYESINGSTYIYIGSVSSTTTSYVKTGLIANSTYKYKVRAVNTDGTASSTSNSIQQFAKSPRQPLFVYINHVTVDASSRIEVEFRVDLTAGLKGFKLLRSEGNASNFVEVDSKLFVTGQADYAFYDNATDVFKKIYYYQIQVMDSCNNPSILSNISKNILCTAKAIAQFKNYVEWDDYITFAGGVTNYKVYRAIDGVFNPTPIATLAFGTNNLTDDVDAFTFNSGKISYYVQAEEGAGNPYGFMDESNSNVADAYQEDAIFIPNAFVVRGVNRVFLPVVQYIEKTDYVLRIFNRFGEKIFETTDDTQGWNGQGYEGGVYVYQIVYKNAKGEFKEVTGTVTQVR